MSEPEQFDDVFVVRIVRDEDVELLLADEDEVLEEDDGGKLVVDAHAVAGAAATLQQVLVDVLRSGRRKRSSSLSTYVMIKACGYSYIPRSIRAFRPEKIFP